MNGESGGARGALPIDSARLDNLADVVDDARRQFVGLPLILLGHSLGGLVVSRFVALRIRPVEALVMSSPALDAGLSAVQKLLLATACKFAPDLRVNNGLDQGTFRTTRRCCRLTRQIAWCIAKSLPGWPLSSRKRARLPWPARHGGERQPC